MHATLVGLPDGRRLELAALGPPAGRPVLYFHGAVGSPLRRCPDTERAVHAAGVRLLLVNRPGFGASDPSPGRALADWPADVAALADALDLERFAVLGVSAGGPYAAACGWAMPDRLTAVAISSGVVPLWGEDAPVVERRATRPTRRSRSSRVTGEAFMQGLRAVRTHGVRGMLDDARIALGPWGFAPEDVDREVQLWHGAQDTTVPLRKALAVADRLAHCHATVLLDEGHFFLRRRMTEILGSLVAAGAAERARRPAA